MTSGRIIRNATITLRQENGETILGPVAGALAKKFIIIGAVVETFVFLGIVLYFTIGPGSFEKDMVLFIVLFVTLAALSGSYFIGAIVYDTISTKQKRRFCRKASGEIVVKNEGGDDVPLSGDKPEFSVQSAVDRDGNTLYDVWMKYGSTTHYILSGHDRDDMTRLRDALHGACAE